MDIHPHPPAHSFKELLVQLFTITLGVLIALGLEGLVEWQHHRSLVREAREMIDREIEDNRKDLGGELALMLTRFLAAYLYGVSPTSPLALGGAVGLMTCVACAAGLVPAVRAARQNPLETLRNL